MAVSVEQFGKAVTSSQLLTADEVRAVWGTTPAAERPKDGTGFARLLVAQKKLTEFQAAEILAGRGARLIMGEYSLLAKIGAGGMGQVYKAQHRRMKRVVALKVMSGAAMKDEAAVKRFQREVQAAARLEHPNIVTAYDSGEAGSVKYLVMQFVDGGDLSDLVKKTGPLPVEQAVGYVLQAAKGLAFAHNEGVIHRDIKPANLLLDKKGIIKILDMGLARIEGGDDGLTATEQVMGTVDYMSPEQAANTKTADARADIYSLGCTLWYLLTAKKVYDGDSMIGRLMAHRDAPLPSLVKTRDDVPWPLEQAFHKLIAKRPQDRFQSMDEVVAALEPFAGGGSSSSGSHSVSGSGAGNSAALASFMQAMGSNPAGPSGASSTQAKSPGSKTSVAAQLDATEQFDRSEVDTDPKSAVVPTSAGFTPTVGALPKTSKPRPKNGRPPGTGNKTKLIAGGFIGAALLLVAGIIVKIRDKDGNVVAEVNAPSGVSVEVVPTKPTPVATVNVAQEAALNRTAAEWVLSVGGRLEITPVGVIYAQRVSTRAELLPSPYHVTLVSVATGPSRELRRLNGLTHLVRLDFSQSQTADADFALLQNVPNLSVIQAASVKITDSSLKLIPARFPAATDIDLRNVIGVTDAGLKHLEALPKLSQLRLQGTSVSADGVSALKKALPNCVVDWSASTAGSPPLSIAADPPISSTSTGWQSLFNGRDFTGWTMMGFKGWTVAAGGELVGRTNGPPGWLMSDADFDDFELECEYKLGPDGNSGVFFRAWPEGKVNGGDFQEVQLLDDNSPKFSSIGGNTRTGAIYKHAAPSHEVRPPSGQWHKFRLAVFKNSARISINDTQVVATELADGKRSSGRIGLQLHSEEVSFRNVRVRPLKSDGTPRVPEATVPPSSASSPGGGYTLRFDGNSSVEIPSVAWGPLRNFTIEAYGRSDESGPSEKSQFIVDIYKHSSLHRFNGHWDLTAKYEDQAVPAYARDKAPSPAGRWDHLAGVVRDDAMHFYVNGKKVASTQFVKPRDMSLGNKLSIGKNFLGSIREVRVSKIPRYDGDFIPRPRFEADADTLALYHCDEGTGNVLKDVSGSELHGTLLGATWERASPESLSANAAEWIDVLPLIDPKQDKFNLPGLTGINDWRMVGGELEYLGDSKNGKLLWPITLLGPAMEFEVEFTRRAGSQGFNLDIPAAAGPCPIVFDTNKRGKVLVGHTGIELPGDFMIVNDQRITVGVKITRQETVDLVQVTWDGSLLGTWRGDRESIAAKKQEGYRHDRHQGFWIPGPQQFIFHKIRARPLQGGSIEPTRRASGGVSIPAAAAVPIFNGTDLAGWTGKPGVWKWEAGELVGTLNVKDVTYLSGSNRYRDFELEYEVKLQGPQANAGAQFRSTLFDAAPFAMTGPQVEIGGGKTGYGGLWWQSGPRNGVVSAVPPETFQPLVKRDDYNRMTVRSVGKRVTITLNGTTTIDGDFDLPDEGLLGWQLVSQDEPATVRFRNIVFRDLSTGAPTTGAAAGPPIDLLAAIQIPRDVVAGGWQKQGAILITTGGPNIGTGHNRLYLPTPGPVPAEYDLELDIERKSNSGTGFVVGFVMGGKQATAMIDSYGPSDHWGIDEIDGETLRGNANPTKNVKRRLIIDQPTKVRLEIRKAGVRVFCAAEKVVDWQGRPEQLSTTFWSVPNTQSLFLGSQSTFHIRSIQLKPIASTTAQTATPASTDLLAAVAIPRDVVAGPWSKQGSVLVTTPDGGSGNQGRIYLPTAGPVPAEYDIDMVIERKGKSERGMVFGFVSGGRQATVMMDSYANPNRWGIEEIDGKGLRENPTNSPGLRLAADQRKTVRVEVRTGGVRVFCDAEKVVDWQGRPEQLSTSFWDVPNKQSLFLGSQAVFHIHSIKLTPRAE